MTCTIDNLNLMKDFLFKINKKSLFFFLIYLFYQQSLEYFFFYNGKAKKLNIFKEFKVHHYTKIFFLRRYVTKCLRKYFLKLLSYLSCVSTCIDLVNRKSGFGALVIPPQTKWGGGGI